MIDESNDNVKKNITLPPLNNYTFPSLGFGQMETLNPFPPMYMEYTWSRGSTGWVGGIDVIKPVKSLLSLTMTFNDYHIELLNGTVKQIPFTAALIYKLFVQDFLASHSSLALPLVTYLGHRRWRRVLWQLLCW